jgi:hypothetical protein
MSWVAAAVAGSTLIGGYFQNKSQKDAANQASNAQQQAADKGIAEQQRQFDAMRQLQQPYVDAGTGAMAGQMDLLGLNGMGAQQGAVNGIASGAQYNTMLQQGENAMLQNASATGGLRGGNTQNALMQFRPQLLNQLIDQQYQKLGGLTSMGQNAAAGVGNAGMMTGQNVSNLFQQQGAAQAGASLAAGKANSQFINSATGAFTNFLGAKF